MAEQDSNFETKFSDRADPFIRLLPLLQDLAKEGYFEVISELRTSKDPEGGLIRIQNAIKMRLYAEAESGSSGGLVPRSATAAEREFLDSQIMEEVIAKKREKSEAIARADFRKNLPAYIILAALFLFVAYGGLGIFVPADETKNVPAESK